MMRGDNDLFSIMNEMAGESDAKSKAATVAPQSSPKKRRARLIPEINGYGEDDRICPENGKESVWNPYIAVNLEGVSLDTPMVTPPTCPHVEVVRRRAYEKFKKKFHTSFNWITSNSQPNGQTQTKKIVDVNSLWVKLPSHSILERYHFACKVSETFQVMEARKSKNVGTLPKRASVGQIANLINLGKEENILIDPILLSTQNQASGVLLRNEIQFQFAREWRKATKGKDLEQVNEFFTSKSFLNRCTKISRAINDIGIEAESELLRDLRKKASEHSSNSSGKDNRKGVPKISLESRREKDSKEVTESYAITLSGLSFRISKPHFIKLQRLFDRHNQTSSNQQVHQDSFLSSLFTILARYDLLEGAGLQSSLNGNVFDVLLKRFNCNMECFASPFNCRYGKIHEIIQILEMVCPHIKYSLSSLSFPCPKNDFAQLFRILMRISDHSAASSTSILNRCQTVDAFKQILLLLPTSSWKCVSEWKAYLQMNPSKLPSCLLSSYQHGKTRKDGKRYQVPHRWFVIYSYHKKMTLTSIARERNIVV